MKNKFVAFIVSALTVVVMRALGATLRVRHHHIEHVEAAKKTGFIFCCWHQNLVSAALGPVRGPYVVMASRSPTADPIAAVCRSLGHTVVRGSSSKDGRDKGGKTAMAEMTECLNAGQNGAMAADGPTGPAKVAKPGIVIMAAETGRAVVPITPMPSRYWQFNSWDKMRLPKPFSVIDVYYGEPTFPAKGISKEQAAELIEQVSNVTTQLQTAHESKHAKQ